MAVVIVAVGMPSVAVASVICTDYLIVGARGTDQPITGDARGLGPEVDDFASSFENLAVSADETVATEAVVYPAVGIPGDGPIRISNSRAFGEMVAFYSTSVSTGASEVERMVEEHEAPHQRPTTFLRSDETEDEVVATADQSPANQRFPGHSGDAREHRDDLPSDLRPCPRRAQADARPATAPRPRCPETA